MTSTSAAILPLNTPSLPGAHTAHGPGPALSAGSSHHSITSASSQSAHLHIHGNVPHATAANTSQTANSNRQQRKMKTARDNTAELNRIQVERIWADRIDKELHMQRAFPSNWGFLVGKAAVQGPAASSKRSEQDAFTVKSALHPPTSVCRAYSTVPAASMRAASSSSKRAGTSHSVTATSPVHINQHTNPHTHHFQSVYKSAYTPAVFTFHGGGQSALPDRFAALPNKKELRQATRTIAIQQRQQQQEQNSQQRPETHVPPTSNSEYGWRFPGTAPLERYGSTSANHRQAYAQVSRRDGGLLPAARKPKAGPHGK